MKPALLSTAFAVAALALSVTSTAAHAGDRVNWSVGISTGPAVVYAPPAVAYPQPVYVQPQPVYVEQPPVVVYGSPGYVVYGQPYYAERPRHHHHRHDYNGGDFRQGNGYYRDRD